MNILVIGNGFDLAHGLPTRYIDFLEWVKAEYTLYIEDCENKGIVSNVVKVDWAIKSFPSKMTIEVIINEYIQMEIWKCISNNFWIDYFLNKTEYLDENWIDFESEISKIIQSVDTDMQGKSFEELINELSNEYLKEKYLYKGHEALFEDEKGKRGGKQDITFKEIRDELLDDLNKLIRALEIYLCEYVEKVVIQKKSPDIEALKIDGILSFNYTNTYEKIYDDIKGKEYDYIHGKADINNTIETNNMVLGIDEYLPKDRKDKDIEFIAFKKYYQRIYKETGCKHKDWINAIREENDIYMERKHDCEIFLKNGYGLSNEIEETRSELEQLNENPPRHNLYIFGHSLDVTDKDILRDLILNDNVYTTIFYPDKKELGRKIANLVKVIGQDELIKRTGGSTKAIEFKLQQPMVSAE